MRINFVSRWASLAMPGLVAMVVAAQVSYGDDYYTTVPPIGTVKINPDGEGATDVREVRGKEYSHTNHLGVPDPRISNIDDHDAGAVFDPAQVVSWDGIPGPVDSGAVDGFDFEPGLLAVQPNLDLPQVDALANRHDALFRQVIKNEATLLFSMTADSDSAGPKARVHFSDPDPIDGSEPADIWAHIEAANGGPGAGVNHHEPIYDLDALEVWGPEPPSHNDGDTLVREGYVGGGPGVGTNTADADRFSLDVDSATGTSVWAYDIATGTVGTWIPHSVIVDAVEDLFLGPGKDFAPETRDQIDVDGTMARDVGGSSPTQPIFTVGDELLFTIDPIDEPLVMEDATGGVVPAGFSIDGGEVMHLAITAAGLDIKFLDHGGHLWDTAFDVMGTFGYAYEDVDALEAVGVLEGTDINAPEPGTALICGLALVAIGSYRLRRNR